MHLEQVSCLCVSKISRQINNCSVIVTLKELQLPTLRKETYDAHNYAVLKRTSHSSALVLGILI